MLYKSEYSQSGEEQYRTGRKGSVNNSDIQAITRQNPCTPFFFPLPGLPILLITPFFSLQRVSG